MSINISPVIFNTGPDDSLAAVDVYTNAPSTPINTDTPIVPGGPSFLDGALKKLSGIHFPLKDQLQYLGYAIHTGDANTGLLAVAQLVGTVQGGIKNLKKDVINQLLGSVGVTPQVASNLMQLTTVQGRQSYLTKVIDQVPQGRLLLGTIDKIHSIKDIETADGYVKLVAAITGNPDIAKVTSMDAQAQVAGIVAVGLTSQKLSAYIGTLGAPFAPYPELNDQYMTAVANGAAINCDMAGLNIALGSQNTPDFDPPVPGLSNNASLCVANPMIINDVVNNYISKGNDIDSDGFPITKTTESAQLVETLTKINANWQTTDRAGTQVSDLTVFQGCTPDAKNLFMLHPDTVQSAVISDSYPPMTVKDIISKSFPIANALEYSA